MISTATFVCLQILDLYCVHDSIVFFRISVQYIYFIPLYNQLHHHHHHHYFSFAGVVMHSVRFPVLVNQCLSSLRQPTANHHKTETSKKICIAVYYVLLLKYHIFRELMRQMKSREYTPFPGSIPQRKIEGIFCLHQKPR